MLPPLFRLSPIIDALDKGELILTSNQRLRSKALQAWTQEQKQRGNKVFSPPRIFTLSQWFAQQWQQLVDQADPRCLAHQLTTQEEVLLWEQCSPIEILMQPELLCKQAMDGWHNLKRWQLPLAAICQSNAFTQSPESSEISTETYQQWCVAFELHLQQENALTQEMSWEIVVDSIKAGTLVKEPVIHLLGFDTLPPLYQSLIESAADKIITVEQSDFQPQTLQRVGCQDTQSEFKAAANWAKVLIEANVETRIGIIIPNLGQCRAQIERALVEAFEPHSLHAATERYTLPFNISTGIPLASTPLIATAFNLLNLHNKQQSVEALIPLLLSPFWGNFSEEMETRSQLANRIQNQGTFDIPLCDVRYFATEGDDSSETNTVFNQLSAFEQYQRQCRGYQIPSAWVDHFLNQLALLQWPGERRPDSHEYQQTQHFYQLLESFAALDDRLGAIPQTEAISRLQSMANKMPFQAQVPDSPIQVLGILEGAGLHFEHCWIMGLHQQAWPPSPNPNPLLPISLQREHQMPNASHLRELELATSLTEGYRHCAQHIIFSSPKYDPETELGLAPSSLISDINEVQLPPFEQDYENYLQTLFNSQQWQWVDCDKAPAVVKTELKDGVIVKHGSSVFKDQAASPFNAFAKHRLNAKIPVQPALGFSPIEQGNILHKSLETLWSEWGDQATLLSLSEDVLQGQVEAVVTTEVEKCRKRKPYHLPSLLCELESSRQTRLILLWLTIDRERPAFGKVITEQACKLSLNGVEFELKIDRIDQLSDSEQLIIDYKTGQPSPADWASDFPKEPQLPLYLLAMDETVIGIAFGKVSAKGQALVGLQKNQLPIDGLKSVATVKNDLPTDWEGIRQHWRTVLEKLLSDYLEGDCSVVFRNPKQKGYDLDLLSLNREYDQQRFHRIKVTQEQH